jgi:hypothetical protein
MSKAKAAVIFIFMLFVIGTLLTTMERSRKVIAVWKWIFS